jgi:FkbM family methyltransferase
VRLYPANNRTDRKATLRPDQMDRRELAFLRREMAQGPTVFVDIGANSGFWSLHAAFHAAPGSQIIAIEPASEVLARLSFNAYLAYEDGRIDPTVGIRPVNVAIGERDGEARLSDGSYEGGRSLLGGSGRAVSMRTLAGLLDECGIAAVDIMKFDVEGYEDHVLPPYFAAAPPARWPRMLIIEHVLRARWGTDCLDACEARGYQVLFTTRSNTVLTRQQR